VCGASQNETIAPATIWRSVRTTHCWTASCEQFDTTTHSVLQAVMDTLCTVSGALETLATEVSTNYVKKTDLDGYIQEYLDEQEVTSLMKNKMVPYTVVEYYGTLDNFDVTGAGTGLWEHIYLCNGQNGTPDKRGRVGIGVTSGMGGGALDAAVDPVNPYNYSYTLYQKRGEGYITLTSTSQIPSHTHTNNVSVTDAGHSHYMVATTGNQEALTTANPIKLNVTSGDNSYLLTGIDVAANIGKTSTAITGVTVNVVNNFTGGTTPHNNIQPVIAAYYIMYIP